MKQQNIVVELRFGANNKMTPSRTRAVESTLLLFSFTKVPPGLASAASSNQTAGGCESIFWLAEEPNAYGRGRVSPVADWIPLRLVSSCRPQANVTNGREIKSKMKGEVDGVSLQGPPGSTSH